MVSKTLLKSLEDLVDSFFVFKMKSDGHDIHFQKVCLIESKELTEHL